MKRLLLKHLKLAVLVVVGLGLVGFANLAKADWNPGDPFKMHYPQLPDMTPSGMDVLATLNSQDGALGWKILADDFLCTQTGPISDVHIWGSWWGDLVGLNTTFKLSIHLDDRTGPYSQPGQEVWSWVFAPGSYTARLYGTTPGELFFDPNLNLVIGTDTTVWQYNFADIPSPFIQQAGQIYWLDVQAWDPDPQVLFGWKTTNPLETPHFEDDAVFGDTPAFGGPLVVPPGWRPLVYPPGTQFAGESIDMAFVITPEPGVALLTGLGLLALFTVRRRH